MAQQRPEFEQNEECKDLVEKIINKFPDFFDGINVDSIACYSLVNKEPKDNKLPWELKTVPYPMRLDLPYDYYLVVNGISWDGMPEKNKKALVFAALCSVDREQIGKVIPPDLKDRAIIVRTLGPDYLERDDIPDILSEDLEWKQGKIITED